MNDHSQSRVKRTNLVDEVIRAIQALLEDETFDVGDKLPSEAALAQRFGVSRPTIREALRVLSHLGLVESRSGAGTFVARRQVEPGALYRSLSNADLAVVTEFRFILESQAARLAAERRSEAQMEKIEAAWNRARENVAKGDLQGFVAEDLKFHAAIVEAAGNWLLRETYERSHHLIEQAIGSVLDVGPFETMSDVHNNLLQAIKDRDPDRAYGEVRNNFDEVKIRVRYIES